MLQWSFSIAFAPLTFKFPSASRFFSASLADNSPLPSWLKFSADSIDFHGFTPSPSPSNGSSTYHVQICGGSEQGQKDVCDSFFLMVTEHALSSSTTFGMDGSQTTVVQRLNFTAGLQTVDAAVPWDIFANGDSVGLQLDGKPLDRSDVSRVEVDTSSVPWLAWDEKSV